MLVLYFFESSEETEEERAEFAALKQKTKSLFESRGLKVKAQARNAAAAKEEGAEKCDYVAGSPPSNYSEVPNFSQFETVETAELPVVKTDKKGSKQDKKEDGEGGEWFE